MKEAPFTNPRQRQPTGVPQEPAEASSLAKALYARRLSTFLGETTAHPVPVDGSLDSLLARTAEVYSCALTEQTRRSYVRRWRDFEAWATRRGLEGLPASPETVLMYMLDLAHGTKPVGIVTLRGRLAAINRVHLESGLPEPGANPAIPVFLRGMARVIGPGARVSPISALRVNELRQVVAAIPTLDPKQVRDRALLELHAAGLSDRALAQLTWDRIQVRRGVALIVAPGSNGSSTRHRLKDSSECHPAAALLSWRSIATESPARVFTPVDVTGQRSDRPMHASEVRRTITVRLDSLGFDGEPATARAAIGLLTGMDPLALRDRALLLVGFAGAFRRTDLTYVRWSDVTDDPDGLIIHLRFSKTDREGRGRDVGIPYGKSLHTCPVTAMTSWRAHVQHQLQIGPATEQPCFVTVGRAGRLGTEPVTPETVTRIVVARARNAGIDGHWGGRSLRAGFISTAADLDIPLEVIARQSRHATLDNLVRYIRRDLFQKNAAERIGL